MTIVYYDTIPVADLNDETPLEAPLALAYRREWEARASAFPLSLTMPLGQGPYGAERVLPFLANLLPETHLNEIGLRLKVSPQDVLGLLAHLGRDTAGAFSFGAPRKAGNNLRPVPDAAALERIIDALPERPFLVGEHGVSMSLAGVQDKLPVFVGDGGAISIPVDGTPSTHILKPDIRRLAGSVENEAFCLMLAKLCGLPAAEATVGIAGSRRYLLVARYDRITDAAGVVRRVHQEDLCQLTGLLPAEKYQRSGRIGHQGATLAHLFQAVAAHVSPGERLALMDGVIFNALICNSDSHAKNYSVLIGAGSTARLAPFYDLMCAAVYQNVDQSLPQAIAGKLHAAELHGADWKALAETVGLSAAATLRRVEDLAERVTSHTAEAARAIAAQSGDPSRVLERVTHEIAKRCARIRRQVR
ncbi:type II toxin-antitoxin system HipA family toxin [Rhizobium halophytocola]|uniref:Serine/threonine-protein kinase HipA n=1 Tax=Rhizobium halophytocola TaxID=735519 RepID=A0ABS4DVL7_9HYPH|nr:type II toxin-antitoxin system HipA family toxin [Rhizobium halophytocola]MBP1849679.1 serine/threonine-protein kinase HipA [Rhizobium halophytocola]